MASEDRRHLLSWLLWSFALGAWSILIAVESVFTTTSACELAPGSSIYGEASWTWMPPGRVCEWTLSIGGSSVSVVSEPPVARLGILVVLIVWAGTIFWVRSTGEGEDG